MPLEAAQFTASVYPHTVLHIGEGQAGLHGGIVLSEGGLHGDIASGHSEGILAVALVSHGNGVPLGIGNGNTIGLVALVGSQCYSDCQPGRRTAVGHLHSTVGCFLNCHVVAGHGGAAAGTPCNCNNTRSSIYRSSLGWTAISQNIC